jgi:hypothetical protein
MPNRSQEENLSLLLTFIRNANEEGITIEQAREQVFNDDNLSKTDIKKLLEHLKNKGLIQIKFGKLDVIYRIIPGK